MDKETLTSIQVNVKQAEERLAELRKDIDTARKAGLDVKEWEQTYKDLYNKVSLLKAAYK